MQPNRAPHKTLFLITVVASFLLSSTFLPAIGTAPQSAFNEESAQTPSNSSENLETSAPEDFQDSSADSRFQVDTYGDRLFTGEPTKEQSDIGNLVAELIGQHEETFGSGAFYSDYSGLEVYVKDGAVEGTAELEKLIIELGAESYVHLVPVERSIAELDAAVEALGPLASLDEKIVSIGPDVIENGLQAGISEEFSLLNSELDELEEDLENRSAPPSLARNTKISNIPIRIVEGVGVQEGLQYTRTNDSSPFYSGGEINSARGPDGRYGLCTLGLPVDINGVFYTMTAAHCTGTYWQNPSGSSIGTEHFTPWTWGLPTYGDWKLFKGKHYMMWTFNGTKTSSSVKMISQGTTSRRLVGQSLCVSGSQGGQVCRMFVVGTRQKRTMGSYNYAFLTIARYRPNLAPTEAVCNATKDGDSGGPVYFADNLNSNAVIGYGIHHGNPQTKSGICEYAFTEFAAVVSRYPAAKVG